jgi:hypothetical protein
VVVLVHDCVAPAAPNHRAVDGERERPRDRRASEQGQPEAPVAEACLQGAWHEDDRQVVDELHDRDRDGCPQRARSG